MHKFPGFPQKSGRTTPLPASFFSDLLPLVDDLAELKVTLFCFYALYQKEGRYRYLCRRDFAGDAALMAGLAACQPGTPADTVLDAALERACARQTLLWADVNLRGEPERLYFVNTALGRVAVEQIEAGEWQPGDMGDTVEILPPRPNVYELYESNIGPLTPMIADRLKDAETSYPSGWIEDAIRAAVENNARSWRYIEAVLRGREKEGKYGGAAQKHAQPDGQRYITGKYGEFFDH
jgi:DnaD/phage-associated family protein